MVHHDDNLALWIAVIIIVFSLLINLGIASVVGEAVRGPNANYQTKAPLVLSVQDLQEGVILARGNTNVIVPDQLVGKLHSDVFRTVESNIRLVENNYAKRFQQGKKIWIPASTRYQKDIRKYTVDGVYTDTLVSQDLKIKVFGKDHVVWVYNP